MASRREYDGQIRELALGARLFIYSFAFMLGTEIALLAIVFMLLVWSLE